MAGVLHTAAPSWPGGTVNVCHRTAPVASSSATTLPRACELSLFGPDVPMYTVPRQYVGLPNTDAFAWFVRTVSQRSAPVASENASSRGLPDWATGTNAVAPPGAA